MSPQYSSLIPSSVNTFHRSSDYKICTSLRGSFVGRFLYLLHRENFYTHIRTDALRQKQQAGRPTTSQSLSIRGGAAQQPLPRWGAWLPRRAVKPGTYSHISVVNERPAAGSLQSIIQEILQSAITRVSLVSDAGPRSAQDAAPFCALGTGDEKCPVSAGLRSPGVQTHKADFQFLLPSRREINFPVGGFFHHPYSLTDPNECVKYWWADISEPGCVL